MPRLKMTKKENLFKAKVRFYMELNDITKGKLAKVWGITIRAADERLNNPNRIPVGDFIRLTNLLGCSLNELADSLKYY